MITYNWRLIPNGVLYDALLAQQKESLDITVRKIVSFDIGKAPLGCAHEEDPESDVLIYWSTDRGFLFSGCIRMFDLGESNIESVDRAVEHWNGFKFTDDRGDTVAVFEIIKAD